MGQHLDQDRLHPRPGKQRLCAFQDRRLDAVDVYFNMGRGGNSLDRRKVVEGKITKAESVLKKKIPGFEEKFAKWLNEQRPAATEWQVLRPTFMKTNLPRLEVLEDGSLFSTGDITKRDEFTLRFNRRKSKSRGKLFYRLVQQAVAVDPATYKMIVHPVTEPKKIPKPQDIGVT